jgi:hypothetical protein
MSDRSGNVVRLPGASLALPQPLSLRYAGDIDGPPPAPHWTVDGVLLPGTVCLFAGASNIGKSLATLQMLVAIALGQEWMGRATEQGRCLAIFCEDMKARIDSRCLDICAHYDVHNSVIEHELAWMACPDRETLLWQTEFGKGAPTPLFHQLFGGGGYLGNGEVGDRGYRVVLLDTAAAVFDGNHNNTAQVSQFMRALTREAIRHNCTIIINAHPSRGAKQSFGGSGQWEAVARFGFNLARPKPPPGVDEEDMAYGDFGLQRVFRGLGSNYVATPRPEKWRWRDGVFVIDELAIERARKRPLNDTERRDLEYRLLIGLKRAMQNGVQVPADEMAARSLANLARRCSDSNINRVPLNDLYLAQAALLDSGQIVRVAVGRKCLIRPHDGPVYQGEERWEMGRP